MASVPVPGPGAPALVGSSGAPEPAADAALAAKVKRVMLADDDVGRMDKETPVAMAGALAGFVAELARACAAMATERGDAQLLPGHLAAVAAKHATYDFLADAVAAAPPLPEAKGAPPPTKKRKQRAAAEGAAAAVKAAVAADDADEDYVDG